MTAAEVFSGMSRGVRVLSKMQLPPDVLARINPPRRRGAPPEAAPDVVFYTGCNVLRTPHIALLCLDVLDTLGVRYEVMGGPSACCGIFQYRAGDAEGAGRVGFNTIERLGGAGTGEVLSWCPSCQTQLGEVTLPTFSEVQGADPFALTPFIEYVADRLDRLAPLMTHPVRRAGRPARAPGPPRGGRSGAADPPRHSGPRPRRPRGAAGGDDVEQPLRAPRLQGEAPRARVRGGGGGGGRLPSRTIFHACHREICHYESGRSFEILNFMELVGESLGLRHEDALQGA